VTGVGKQFTVLYLDDFAVDYVDEAAMLGDTITIEADFLNDSAALSQLQLLSRKGLLEFRAALGERGRVTPSDLPLDLDELKAHIDDDRHGFVFDVELALTLRVLRLRSMGRG